MTGSIETIQEATHYSLYTVLRDAKVVTLHCVKRRACINVPDLAVHAHHRGDNLVRCHNKARGRSAARLDPQRACYYYCCYQMFSLGQYRRRQRRRCRFHYAACNREAPSGYPAASAELLLGRAVAKGVAHVVPQALGREAHALTARRQARGEAVDGSLPPLIRFSALAANSVSN